MESDLHVEILQEDQRKLLRKLEGLELPVVYYMAGDTALALQIGHRQSMDFDFFVPGDIPKMELLSVLRDAGTFELFSESKNTIHGQLDGVQVSFISYKYEFVGDLVKYGSIELAGLHDIACMKLDAISSRGTRRDFIDLYHILKQMPLEMILDDYDKKTVGSGLSRYQLLKSLVYFEDAEQQPMPKMLNAVNWDDVKVALEQAVSKIGID